MFTVKTSAMLKALKPYESFATPEDVQKDLSLKALYERKLFFTEKTASYTVYYTTDQPIVEYVVLLTIGDDVFNDYKQVDYCLEASATEIDLDERL